MSKDFELLTSTGCILVRDEDKYEVIELFNEYLIQEGFKCIIGHNWGCPWWFVNISNKVFVPGRPGIGYAKPMCEVSITIEEFKKIYNIFKKHIDEEKQKHIDEEKQKHIDEEKKKQTIKRKINLNNSEENLLRLGYITYYEPNIYILKKIKIGDEIRINSWARPMRVMAIEDEGIFLVNKSIMGIAFSIITTDYSRNSLIIHDAEIFNDDIFDYDGIDSARCFIRCLNIDNCDLLDKKNCSNILRNFILIKDNLIIEENKFEYINNIAIRRYRANLLKKYK
ncbi:MAG: hypothetical protein MR024_02000 [Firmicutes bacterium]|nr:hypothetical protein [Bacillota bacterium]